MRTAETATQHLVRLGLWLFAVLCAGLCYAMWRIDDLPELYARGVAIGFILAAVPALVLLHECGHFGMAKLLGWKVLLISWGPFTVRFGPFRFTTGAPAFGSNTAGAVVSIPPDGAGSNFGWGLLFLGGPLASGLAGGAAAFTAHAAAAGSTAESFFILLAVLGGFDAAQNLWPRPGSDGGQLLNIILYRTAPLRNLYARLSEHTLRGVRPRDWPQAFVTMVQRQALWSGNAELQLALYAWQLDRGDAQAARVALTRSESDERVWAELAFLVARYDGDAGQAAALLKRTHSWSVHSQTCYWRAEAALAAACGETARARSAIRKGRILCREWPYATAFDSDLFDALEKDLPI